MAASYQAADLKSSAKFTNTRTGSARNSGLTISPLGSDAADAVKKRPPAPAACLPASDGPS